jgi:hypothetical protein
VFIKKLGMAWRTRVSPAVKKRGEPLGEPVRLRVGGQLITKGVYL